MSSLNLNIPLVQLRRNLRKFAGQPKPVARPRFQKARAQLRALPLTPSTRGQLVAALRPTEGNSVLTLLEAGKRLPVVAQVRVLQAAAANPSDAALIAQLITSPGFKRLSAMKVGAVAALVASAGSTRDTGALYQLVRLFRDRPALIQQKDSRGQTLLDNLSQLATAPLSPQLALRGVTQAQLLDAALSEVVQPSRINQSVYGTCTVTTMQYDLARRQPSEYVRLVAGIAGFDEHARMRGGGLLTLQPEYFDKPTRPLPLLKNLGPRQLQPPQTKAQRDGRSLSEALFQSAAIEYANGHDDYDAQNDLSLPAGGGKPYAGLGPGQLDLLRQLHGVQYVELRPNKALSPGDVLAHLQRRSGKAGHPVVVGMDIGDLARGEHGFHAFSFVAVKGGRVYLRNPWGEGRAEVNGMRREKGAGDVYSIDAREFRVRLSSILTPRPRR